MSVSINYPVLQATALSILTALGNQYTLNRPISAGATANDQKMCSFYGTFDTRLLEFFNSTGGGVVASNQNILYAPAMGKVVPQIGDRVLFGKAQSWRITKVDTIMPDNQTVILYTLTVA